VTPKDDKILAIVNAFYPCQPPEPEPFLSGLVTNWHVSNGRHCPMTLINIS